MGKRQCAVRRRWFRIGPGLLLAILASVLVWRLTPPDPGNIRSGPPRVERRRLDAPGGVSSTAPDPAWLLEQRDALGLKPPQVEKLRRLRARWERNTRSLREDLARASEEFRRSMPAAADGGRSPASPLPGDRGLTLQELQEQAAPVSKLSRRLADARRAWWGEAATVLTRAQRQQAEQAWARRLLPNTRKK